MHKKLGLFATASVVALMGLSVSTAKPVLAQGVSSLEEVIVTARRKEENLFEAPLSVTSLTSEDIDRSNIRGIQDLNNFTPGFFYVQQASFSAMRVAPSLRFRGMNNNFADPLQQQGGIFIDGVFLFGGVQSMTMDDVERVEVIKGPQSALFGRSTFGGAINFITKKPSDTFAARASVSAETRGTYELTGSMEGPIVADRVTARVSGGRIVRGAHFKTNDGGDLGYESTNVINSQVVFKPTDEFEIRLRRMDNWQSDSRSAVVNLNGSNPALANAAHRCQPGTQPFWCGSLPLIGDGIDFKTGLSMATSLNPPAYQVANFPNAIRQVLNNDKSFPLVRNGMPYWDQVPRLDHAGLEGRYNRTSIEASYEFANNMAFNMTWANSKAAIMSASSSSDDGGAGWIISPNILTDNSVEARLAGDPKDRLNWSIGANYFSQKSVGGAAGTGSILGVLDSTRVVTYAEPNPFSGQGRDLYYGVFGALHYDITDRLGADFEGRYQSDRITTSWDSSTQSSLTYKSFLPRAILTYKPTTGMTVYGSWAKGVMPGTINSNFPLWLPNLQAQVLAIPGFTVNVPKETVNNYEIGIKQQLSGWRYALTGYHMFWRNLKNQVSLLCPNNVCGATLINTTILANIPQKARISGIEGELGFAITPNWDVNATFDYVHVRTVNFIQLAALAPTGKTDAGGKTITGFPVTQGAMTSTYRGELNGNWGWYVRGDLTYTGRIYTDEINQSWIGDAFKTNLHIGVENDKTRVEIYGNNLNNDKHWLSSNRGTQSNYRVGNIVVAQSTATVALPRLRVFGIKVTQKFN